MPSGLRTEAFFLAADNGRKGQRFCLHHAPASGSKPRASWVYVHPFAEEMNKSRRMAARQSRALADAGVAVLQIDLFGCGDSSGDFADASWDDWVDDIVMAQRWLQARHGIRPGLWGLRAGCLLAAEAARRSSEPTDFLFWQPVVSGETQLAQFIRIKTAAAMLRDGGTQVDRRQVRAALTRGEPVEVAGYRLAPVLALGMQASRLIPPSVAGHGLWIELGAGEPSAMSPTLQAAVQSWQPAHRSLDYLRVQGPAFWQTQEIEEAPALLEMTVKRLSAWQERM